MDPSITSQTCSADKNAITCTTGAPVFKAPRTKKSSKPTVPHHRPMFSAREIHDFRKKLRGLSKLLRKERGQLPQLQHIIQITLNFYSFVSTCSSLDYDEVTYKAIEESWKPIKDAENLLIRTIVIGDKFEDAVKKCPLKED